MRPVFSREDPISGHIIHNPTLVAFARHYSYLPKACRPYRALETAAFNVFLYGRMIGAAAEIDDHLNRERNMDMRTPQERCRFVV
jgi:transposase